MSEGNDSRKQHRNEQQGADVHTGNLQLAHTGAADVAAVKAALHGGSQLVRAAERRDKQRNENRNHRLGTLNEVAGVKIGAARLLRGDDLLGFLDEGRDKTQCDRHHHGQLVHRYMQLLERPAGWARWCRSAWRSR